MVKTARGKTTRKRRTSEERIADLEAKIAGIREREAAKKVKASPEGKAFLSARRAMKRALEAAREADDGAMVEALENAHGELERHAEKAGGAGVETTKSGKPRAA